MVLMKYIEDQHFIKMPWRWSTNFGICRQNYTMKQNYLLDMYTKFITPYPVLEDSYNE